MIKCYYHRLTYEALLQIWGCHNKENALFAARNPNKFPFMIARFNNFIHHPVCYSLRYSIEFISPVTVRSRTWYARYSE